MRLPVAGPRQLRELAADGVEVGRRLVSVLPRVEQLLDRVTALIVRIEHTEAAARQTVAAIDATHKRARSLIEAQGAEAAELVRALAGYVPALESLQPAVARLAETWHPDEVDAMTAAIRGSPRVAQQLEDQVIPMLEKLQTLGPDLQELLVTSRALNEIVGSLPGLGRAKKRAEEELEQRTGEEPTRPDGGS